jgi:hypothetical protein
MNEAQPEIKHPNATRGSIRDRKKRLWQERSAEEAAEAIGRLILALGAVSARG